MQLVLPIKSDSVFFSVFYVVVIVVVFIVDVFVLCLVSPDVVEADDRLFGTSRRVKRVFNHRQLLVVARRAHTKHRTLRLYCG